MPVNIYSYNTWRSKYLLLTICLLFLGLRAAGQQIIIQTDSLNSKESLKHFAMAVSDLLEEEDFIDTSLLLNVAFSVRIDSTGEVLSAHIIKASNLECTAEYRICRSIENKFNLKDIYDKSIYLYPDYYYRGLKYITIGLPVAAIKYVKKVD